MAGIIVSLGPSLAEEWWSTEPQLQQLDYEAAPNETVAECRSSGSRPHLQAVD